VIGSLSHKINVENSGSGESTNCHLTADDEVDWHIYLTNSPAQQIKSAIIVETTPRTRPQHKWTTAMLPPLVDSKTRVRISGWLMYDSEHINVIGTQRATVWEVHPITKIEIENNGQWVDLDTKPRTLLDSVVPLTAEVDPSIHLDGYRVNYDLRFGGLPAVPLDPSKSQQLHGKVVPRETSIRHAGADLRENGHLQDLRNWPEGEELTVCHVLIITRVPRRS
jgi:hypothetical protein